jgi:hypothetical protein
MDPDTVVDELSVSCPYCGAIPGKPCKRVKGYDFPLEKPRHYHRFEKARKEAPAREEVRDGSV